MSAHAGALPDERRRLPAPGNAGLEARVQPRASPKPTRCRVRRHFLAAVLAALGWALTTGPALADFESAMAAYNRGALETASAEFRSLAAAGDERAKAFLERTRQRLRDRGSAGSSSTSGTGSSSARSASAFGSTASRRGGGAGGWFDFEIWTPPEPVVDAPTFSEIHVPYRRSVWSGLFHLPGDITVISLQHVAMLLDANRFGRDLRILSAHGDKIALSILAAVWWVIILKGLWGLGALVRDLLRAALSPLREEW